MLNRFWCASAGILYGRRRSDSIKVCVESGYACSHLNKYICLTSPERVIQLPRVLSGLSLVDPLGVFTDLFW